MRSKAVNIRLTKELKERISMICAENDISLSDAVRLSLIQFLPAMEEGTFQLRGLAGDTRRMKGE